MSEKAIKQLKNEINQNEEKEQNFRKEKEESRQTIQRLQKEIDNLKIDSKYHFNEKENSQKIH